MPNAYQDVLTYQQQLAAGTIRPTYFGMMTAWYMNRAPAATFIPSSPVNNAKFNMVRYNFKPRSTTLSADINTAVTSIPVVDASAFVMGDVLWINRVEKVEVTADPNVTANTLAVRRAIGGTTATAATSGQDVYNIGNSRTGAEQFQKAINLLPTLDVQYVQTFQQVAAVSGLTNAVKDSSILPPGRPAPFDQAKMDALQSLKDDMENAFLYSSGDDLSGGNTRYKMKGVKQLIVTNNVTSPTNASAYKPTDFMRDVIQGPHSRGGNVDLIMVSSKFMLGLAAWGLPLQRLDPGETLFGVGINAFSCPFLNDIPIVENMWLDYAHTSGYVACGFSMDEIRWRVLEELDYKPYGRNGDIAESGDWIHRAAPEVDNESHHSWVQGITGFAQQS